MCNVKVKLIVVEKSCVTLDDCLMLCWLGVLPATKMAMSRKPLFFWDLATKVYPRLKTC